MGSRAPVADETRSRLDHQVIGNKADAAVSGASTTASLVALTKGLAGVSEATGEADIDISESDYTAFVELLKIEPASSGLADCVVDLDLNKDTTGYDTVSTASDTLDIAVYGKVDGTNYRQLLTATQVTASGAGTVEASGVRLKVGALGPGSDASVRVKVNAERADAEIPYRITYRGEAPTVTAVAAA